MSSSFKDQAAAAKADYDIDKLPQTHRYHIRNATKRSMSLCRCRVEKAAEDLPWHLYADVSAGCPQDFCEACWMVAPVKLKKRLSVRRIGAEESDYNPFLFITPQNGRTWRFIVGLTDAFDWDKIMDEGV